MLTTRPPKPSTMGGTPASGLGKVLKSPPHKMCIYYATCHKTSVFERSFGATQRTGNDRGLEGGRSLKGREGGKAWTDLAQDRD